MMYIWRASLSVLDGFEESLRGEGGGEIGGVGGEEDQGEEVEYSNQEPERERHGAEVSALLHEGAHCVPDAVLEVPLGLQLLGVHHTEVGIEPLVRIESAWRGVRILSGRTMSSVPMRKVRRDTRTMEARLVIHTSLSKGSKKERRLGGAFLGLVYIILIPDQFNIKTQLDMETHQGSSRAC